MRKRSTLCACVTTSALAVTLSGAQSACGSESVPSLASKLIPVSLETSPGSKILTETSPKSADAQDEIILSKTLHTTARLSPSQWTAMRNAAQRRWLRQIDARFSLAGATESVIAAAEFEMQARRAELDLAHVRAIIEAQRVMRAVEADLHRALSSIRWEKPMRKFEGQAPFRASDLVSLSAEFENQFHRPMPVTARGETATHLRLGLDHRGKFDVGVKPESPEGIWLRRALEERQVSYIAFCRAVRGSATAPHVHIGTASTRIPRGQRASFRRAFYRERNAARLPVGPPIVLSLIAPSRP